MSRISLYRQLLPLLFATILPLSGCQKDVLQPARDTVLANLNGDVQTLTHKEYHATMKEDGKEYKMGKMIESKTYTYDKEGMLLKEQTLDANGEVEEEINNRYELNGSVTHIQNENGSEEVTRDLENGKRTRTYKDTKGTTTEVLHETIDDKGLPLVVEAFSPEGELKRKSVWERDVFGHATLHEEYVEGVLVYRITSNLNKAGDPVSEVETNDTDTIARRSFIYNYDGKGNWIQRVTRHMPKGDEPYYTISERGITYF